MIQYQVQRNVMWEERKSREYFDSHQHKNLCLDAALFTEVF